MKPKTSSKNNHWSTPKYLFDKLDKEFDFDFDPCPLNHDISLWDGLQIEWGESNFVNPPYSTKEKEAFIKKAISESKRGKLCVVLVPVSTSTKLFHEVIQPNKSEIRFVKGRVKFEGYNRHGKFIQNSNAMHDSMIIVFDGRKTEIDKNGRKSM